MHALGRWLQSRQPIALALLLAGLTTAMVGGVTGSWPVIALGALVLLGVLVPMTVARCRSPSREHRP